MFGFIVPFMFGLRCFGLSFVNSQTVQPWVRERYERRTQGSLESCYGFGQRLRVRVRVDLRIFLVSRWATVCSVDFCLSTCFKSATFVNC